MTVDRTRPQRAGAIAHHGTGAWSRRTMLIMVCVAADLAITAGVLWWLLS